MSYTPGLLRFKTWFQCQIMKAVVNNIKNFRSFFKIDETEFRRWDTH